MRTRVKYCGMTNRNDINAAVDLGVDAIGVIFHPQSPRAVTIDEAIQLLTPLPLWVNVVAVLVDPNVAFVETLIDLFPTIVLQFHGQETAAFCDGFKRPYIKAIQANNAQTIGKACLTYTNAAGILLDTPSREVAGGTGVSFDWACVPKHLEKPIILAGGLHAKNVTDAITMIRPYAVDVCSGIEQSKGVKDINAMTQFLAAVRNTE